MVRNSLISLFITAIVAILIPVVLSGVHMSDIQEREDWRKESVTSPVCSAILHRTTVIRHPNPIM